MKVLSMLVNAIITFCVAITFLLLICIADPLVKLVSAMGHRRLAKELTRKIACLVQLLPRAWGTRFNYHFDTGSENWDESNPVIFVSSHHSCFDIVLLTSVLGGLLRDRQFSFISRSGLDRYIPLISFYLRQFCFSLPRFKSEDSAENRRAAHAMLADFARSQVRCNGVVVIFPEGMKPVNSTEHNAPFRRNGLRVLLEQMPDAILVPVAIKGTREFYTTGRTVSQLLHQLPRFFTTIDLSIMPAVEADSIEEKIDLAESQIASEYSRLKRLSKDRKPAAHQALKWIR